MSEQATNSTFDSIFRSYYSRLLRYASLIVGPDDAKDIVQGVFVWLLQHPAKMRDLSVGGECEISQYLLRSVYNACLNHLRTRKHDSEYRNWLYDSSIQSYAMYDPDGDNLIRKLFSQDFERELNRCLDALPPRAKETFILAYREGMGHSRIAEIMGVTVSTVENHLYSALKTLRLRLGGKKDEIFFKLA